MSALSELALAKKDANLIPPPKNETIDIQARKAFFDKPASERTREEYIDVLGMKEIKQKARRIIGNQPTLRKIVARLTDPVKILMDSDLADEKRMQELQQINGAKYEQAREGVATMVTNLKPGEYIEECQVESGSGRYKVGSLLYNPISKEYGYFAAETLPSFTGDIQQIWQVKQKGMTQNQAIDLLTDKITGGNANRFRLRVAKLPEQYRQGTPQKSANVDTNALPPSRV